MRANRQKAGCYTLDFDQPEALHAEGVGGKAANLARLHQAGFPVPAGFVVTTAAYVSVLQVSGVARQLEALVEEFAYDDPDRLEQQSSCARQLVVNASVPEALSADIVHRYRGLSPDAAIVAVRSSGTAEDLSDASFAGQHETFLGVRGADAVLDTVKRCWASLWTARASAYRHDRGFDHFGSPIAVVIQTLVDSDVAGVLFTGNPLTAATDELLVNASWGLGEAVVSGITTPDEYVLDYDTLRVTEKTLGAKAVEIVRDARTGETIRRDVPVERRERFTLSAEQLAELGRLGMRVAEHYEGIPQDIEWCLRDRSFFLLQARAITGVRFSWDADIDAFHESPDDPATIWTRTWADEVWSGAITPLMYSFRANCQQTAHRHAFALWGVNEGVRLRWSRYHKGVMYYNTAIEKLMLLKTQPASFRSAMLLHVAPSDLGEVVNTPLSYAQLLKTHLRIVSLAKGQGIHDWLNRAEWWIAQTDRAEGLADEELRHLSDRALMAYIDECVQLETDHMVEDWSAYSIHVPLLRNLLGWMIDHWYDGPREMVMMDLLTGVPRRSVTVDENLQLWNLATELRRDEKLMAVFRESDGNDFFAKLETSEEGRSWLDKYRAFAAAHHHRGHSDRDIYFPRRQEDPGLDYRSLKALLTADESHDPQSLERSANQRRDAAVADVIENLRTKPFGALKVEAFKLVHDYVMTFAVHRDNARHWVDRSTFTIKRGFLEVGRRLRERGLLEEDRHLYFLARGELYDLLLGRANETLVRAKIAARAANFDEVNEKLVTRPQYLQRNRELAFDGRRDGALKGSGTSRGTATGVARIVRALDDIGLIQEGDILVCNATDPGWSPAFLAVRGVVAETGGILSHFSCLSREYGIPAVQLPDALRRIPDGAAISINGDTGEVSVLEGARRTNAG